MELPRGNHSEYILGTFGHSQESDPDPLPHNRVWLVALLLILAGTTAIRIRLLDMPLERDEGEYAYAGQLLLQGVPPYLQVYTMKWPGTHAAYALIMAVFGQTAAGIHLGLILVAIATAVLVFLLARRLYGDVAGAVAAGTYALLSASPPAYGLAAHAAHFVVLPALGGLFLLQNLDDSVARTRVFFAGLLLGLSALMKQPGAAFGAFAAAWITWNEISRPSPQWRRLALRLAYLMLGGVLPLLLTGFVLIGAGAFDSFWFWTVEYARFYGSLFTPAEGIQDFWEATAGKLFKAAPGLWCLAVPGLLLLFYERSVRHSRFFVLGFLFVSCLAICPGWYFRPHYFLLLIPATSLLAGVAVCAACRWLARLRAPVCSTVLPLLIFAGAAAGSLYEPRAIFFQLTPRQAIRAIYGINPFPEAVDIAGYLAAHCPPEARIAVLGSEPELFFYSHRRSATGFIYMYPLMEPQPYAALMQKAMIREMEQSHPEYVVFVYSSFSWLQRTNSPTLVFDWFEKYRRERLQLVGWVEMLSADKTEYHWSAPQGAFAPRSKHWLTILKDKTASSDTAPEGAAWGNRSDPEITLTR